MNCPFCNHNKARRREYLRQKQLMRYKCTVCGREFKVAEEFVSMRHIRRPLINCLNCGKETSNPKFCSRSCFVSYSNRAAPKRKAKPKTCKHCGVQIPRGRSVCDDCNPSYVDWTKRTIGDIRKITPYQVNAMIRDGARQVFKRSEQPRICRNCGYSKHVEICHIRGISTFPDDTPVSVINDPSNLVALCPNCHWEFDHGLLTL